MSDDLIHIIKVKRLNYMWDAVSALDLPEKEFSLEWVKEVAPNPEYIDDLEKRDLNYHRGRIHYFLKELEEKGDLDPINLDCEFICNHLNPLSSVIDGNHRLLAYILSNRTWIPIHFGGFEETLHYLEGKTNVLPF